MAEDRVLLQMKRGECCEGSVPEERNGFPVRTGAVLRNRIPLWVAVIVLLVGGQFFATLGLPRGFLLTLVSDVIGSVLIAAAVFVFIKNARIADRPAMQFWLLVAAGWLLTLIGQTMWMYFEVVLRKEVPNPFVGDVLLFLSNVPFLAALLLQPHLGPKQTQDQQNTLDFCLLLLWWLYLYLYFVIPWQYVAVNEATYGSSYNALNMASDIVLLVTLAFYWRQSSGRWRRIFASFAGAQVLITGCGYAANLAIDRHVYYPGSWYDVGYAVALASFVLVGLLALALPVVPSAAKRQGAVLPFAGMGVVAVLSLPVFGAWAVLGRNPTKVGDFRELVTFGTMCVMSLLVFAKKRELERQLTAANQELQEVSLTDFLTGVRNRRYFNLRISGEANQVLRSYASAPQSQGLDLLFYMLDLDDFKEVNDCYGHDVGDKILREIAQRIGFLIRSFDVLIRWGGDEFLIISRHTNRAEADAFVSRILTAVAQPISTGPLTIHLTCSIGWAAFPWLTSEPDQVPLEAVLGLSDRALYEAKTAGKNRAVGVSPSPDGEQFVIAASGDRISTYTVSTQSVPGPPPLEAKAVPAHHEL